ncbi:MAG TPA: hypothetical protein VFN35_01865 [Ktedonobacteraceae bacterium]|nr:hypothetical protein [Ktedonobacteraceae bacterium]
MSDNVQKKQDLSRQIINKIVNDPAFREQLTADPKGALVNGGFWESYIELYGSSDAEVSGYSADPVAGSDYCCITGIY